jgi:hypothetical protein
MSKRLVFALAAVACVGAISGSTASADTASAEYPLFATPDGTAVTVPSVDAGEVSPPLAVESYDIPTSEDVVVESSTPTNSLSKKLWGYEAVSGSGARILRYDIGPPTMNEAQCVPTHTAGFTTSQNGRGMAFDPLTSDDNPLIVNAWNTHVFFPGFAGDGFIHLNTVVPNTCAPVKSIPFGDGPGGVVQDDIGAIDVDEATKHLWVAGYQPVSVAGVLISFIYKVNRNNGKIIDFCGIPFRGGGAGNDTLAVYRDSNTSLPGSRKYLLTDAGETVTTPNSLAVIDQADCHRGLIVTPVAEAPKTAPMSGIDFEWPGLLSTDLFNLRDHDDFPFAVFTPLGNLAPSATVEDISLCGFRGEIGGDGTDMCPLGTT